MLKSDWPTPPPVDIDAPFGPNGAAVEACLERARDFTRSEIVRLDLRKRRDPDMLLAAWDHVRDRMGARAWAHQALRRAGRFVGRRA